MPRRAHRSSTLDRVWLAALLAIAPGPVLAGAPRDFATYRPAIAATRIDTHDAPTIDGDLSDAVWNRAAKIDEFYQIDPREGAPPTERTTVRVLYDENNLYFGIMCYDDKPDAMTARVKARDGEISYDDLVRVYLDPFLTRRNGYLFEVNPLGARRDSLLQNNTDRLSAWNALWTARTAITKEGWSVEMAIPFRSLSYDRGRSEWGFDFLRVVRRKNEKIRWSSIDKAVDTIDISREGTLEGIRNTKEGLGLDVQAYAVARAVENWNGDPGSGVSFRPSGNAYYKITPALTGTLTYSPDFSDAPLDQRQVNITRFSLFYPERRDFFLQDAPSFQFGGINISNDAPDAGPFFSRNIGVVNNDPVDILAGGKVSGEYGGVDIGAETVRTDAGGGSGPQELSVLRLSDEVDADSKLGMILTNGDPTGATRNTVAGTDFQYHNSSVFGGNSLEADAFYERSFSSGVGQDDAFGIAVDYPNEPWDAFFRVKDVGANFAPALGFVDRTGIREYSGHLYRRDRYADSVLQWNGEGAYFDVVTGLGNELQTRVLTLNFDFEDTDGDYLRTETWNDLEVTPSFTLPHNIVVPAGQYDWEVWHGHIETASQRFVSGAFDVQCCGFYGGTMLQTDTTLELFPNETVTFDAHHTMQVIHIPTGHVTIHVGSFDLGFNFTPDMQILTQVEYDNISRDLELSTRYRWEFEPGTELLVVFGNDATFNGPVFHSHTSIFSIRLGHLFRL